MKKKHAIFVSMQIALCWVLFLCILMQIVPLPDSMLSCPKIEEKKYSITVKSIIIILLMIVPLVVYFIANFKIIRVVCTC